MQIVGPTLLHDFFMVALLLGICSHLHFHVHIKVVPPTSFPVPRTDSASSCPAFAMAIQTARTAVTRSDAVGYSPLNLFQRFVFVILFPSFITLYQINDTLKNVEF